MSIRTYNPDVDKDHFRASTFMQRREGEQTFQFIDKRPEALQLKRIQDAINKQSSSLVLQKKAGVESFQVQWRKHPEGEGENAAHQIGFKARFKHGDGFNARDAEFRQEVESAYDVHDKDNNLLGKEKNDRKDDGYNRINDPEDYTGENSEVFSGADLAGFHDDSALNPTDDLFYEFTARQMIVDLSDNDKVIAESGPRTEYIWGTYPRKYSIERSKLQ